MPTPTAEKLTRAKLKLLLSKPAQPFFAQLLMGMKTTEDASVNKSANNGQEMKFNPDYIDTLDADELTGHLCTGTVQAALLHHLRRGTRDADTWSQACQYAANEIVLNAGLKLPKDALTSSQFKGRTAEQIYHTLYTEKKENDQGKDSQPDPNGQQQAQGQGNSSKPGNQPGQQPGQQQQDNDPGPMEVQDSPAQTDSEKAEAEAKMKQKVAQAALGAKKAGRLPGYLEQLIADILEPQINWKEALARFVVDIARNDYSFSRPNTRFLHTGFILPSLYNIEPNNIIFIVDKSGSMDVEIFHQIGGEIKDASGQINAGLTLMYVDTQVQGEPIQVDPDEDLPFLCNPSGGTKFSPGFNYIEEHQMEPKAVIYLTDGDCSEYPENEPDYPVLWIVYNNKHFKPPFGEVIKVSAND